MSIKIDGDYIFILRVDFDLFLSSQSDVDGYRLNYDGIIVFQVRGTLNRFGIDNNMGQHGGGCMKEI